jgi:hypothetical protein
MEERLSYRRAQETLQLDGVDMYDRQWVELGIECRATNRSRTYRPWRFERTELGLGAESLKTVAPGCLLHPGAS